MSEVFASYENEYEKNL